MLVIGSQLGPYQILASIGAGGMGEVYRAKDSRLGREVAIKVLPSNLSRDPDRLRRFEQEARAAGMLNHPNILAIYDVGSHDGAPYLISELLEGETLRERMGSKPLSLRKAVDYALQIARGLAAAHEKGITHRDLKPENIFITKDGRVKIFDFGLAKLARPEAKGEGQDASTLDGQTEPGAVLGTVGYMSPEQVRGQPADHRSDIFSFGAILYEMISGNRAFRRDTPVETMNAILKEDTPDLSLANPAIAPALDRMVRHCLEKSPEERFQSARDMAYDLETLSSISGPSTTVAIPIVAGEPPRALPPVQARRRPILAVFAGAGVLAAGLVAGFLGAERLYKTAPPTFHQLTFRRGAIFTARFAPDGQTIIYGAAWDGKPIELFTTRPEGPESRSLGFADTELMAVSPSGELAISVHRHAAGPFEYSGTLARVPLAGGGSREVLEGVREADWAPDGQTLAIVRDLRGGCQLEFPIGKVLYKTSGWVSHARISPKGDAVAFIDHPTVGGDDGSIAVVDRAASKKTLSTGWASAQGVAWTPDGKEIWFTATRIGGSRALNGVSLSGKERLIVRVPGVLTITDIAPSGRVLMTHDNVRQGIVVLPPGETKERDLSWLDFSSGRDLSPDGRTVLFDETGEGGGAAYGVYIRKTDGSPAVRIGDGVASALSPDGKWALAGSLEDREDLTLYPTGPGQPSHLRPGSVKYQWPPAFSADGNSILFTGIEPGHSPRVYVQAIAGGEPRPVTPEGFTLANRRSVSPGGRSLLVLTPEGKLAVYPLDGGAPSLVPGLNPGEQPTQWGPDGRSIYVYQRGELPTQVFSVDLATGRRELKREFIPADPAGLLAIAGPTIVADGKVYGYGYVRMLSDLYLVEGLK